MSGVENPGPEQEEGSSAVTCPHCRKSFVPAPLARPSARHRGFKCPHCRLFVPVERSGDTTLARDGSV
jgi:hypothetical protein